MKDFMKNRIEHRLQTEINRDRAFLANKGIYIQEGFDRLLSVCSLEELVEQLNACRTLVKMVKEEEGKDRLCGG